MPPATVFQLPSPPKDRISSLGFARAPTSTSTSTSSTSTSTSSSSSSPTSSKLLVSSWDGYVYLYDADENAGSGPDSDARPPAQHPGDSVPAENEIPTKGRLIAKFGHSAPVLAVLFGRDENEAFTACLDWVVRRIDLTTGSMTPISRHAGPVCALAYSPSHNLLLSTSWDRTMNVHSFDDADTSSTELPVSIGSITLPDKPFAISVSPTRVVVAMAHRVVNIYQLADLQGAVQRQVSQSRIPIQPQKRNGTSHENENGAGAHGNENGDMRDGDGDDEDRDGFSEVRHLPPQLRDVEPWQRRESSLRFMTRAVACMPLDDGYASSSIEGRVAVEWFDDSDESQARKYAFKCHRQTQLLSEFEAGKGGDKANGTGKGADGTGDNDDIDIDGTGKDEQVDVVYPVNALAFHPVHGTFASGGGDGSIALWDGIAKRRIRQYHRFENSVMAMAFDRSGRRLAFGVSPGFRDGIEEEEKKEETQPGPGGDGSHHGGMAGVRVYVRLLDENEAKPKKK